MLGLGAPGFIVFGLLLGAAAAFLIWVYQQRLAPYEAIRQWVFRMRRNGGELSARVPVPQKGDFAELAADLNVLAEMVQTLSRDTEEQLQEFSDYTAMKERTRLSGELHDSLAQTLAGIKMQVRVLDETLHQGDEERTWEELERIEESLEEANIELRELIAHFRVPISEAGLLPAIERTVERFRRDCPDVRVLLQTQWGDLKLPAEHELQIVRIVQEALANARKHAQASTVRVLISGDAENGNCRVLVEDDGVGFANPPQERRGIHIGLSLLQDRAMRLGGKLQVESEPEEGVRVSLEFKAMPERAAA